MEKISIGQRWISEAESELGLGIVQEINQRLITIFFPATGDERIYARKNAPVSRMTFSKGDTVQDMKGREFTITDMEEMDGLLVYHCQDTGTGEKTLLPEIRLSSHLVINKPADRLARGQLDHPSAFHLRYSALQARDRIFKSGTMGLIGPRTSLIPHQVSIAAEVGERFYPRVLLADEVGLGKTIEAGMIIHQQVLTERARRILILVPDVLVHQWFVEMLRRFNLHFSIFDQERLDSIEEESPFETEQLVLCGYTMLEDCENNGMLSCGWDIVVADEAHHIEYDEDDPCSTYQKFAQLAGLSRGLLLLTATPEQLGIESHFARLRLLDPERFYSLEAFLEEQEQYQPIANLALKLLDGLELDDSEQARLEELTGATLTLDNHEELVNKLLDRNGTGRVFFRNTRKNVPGFRQRQACPVPLQECQIDFDGLVQSGAGFQELFEATNALPESRTASDGRIQWIVSFLKKHRNKKVLVICKQRETAINIELHLRYKEGFNTTVFHEEMDLVSRDRAAAWFADEEDGAQCMVCSEIGSEGRNFQFSSDLILFDLPEHPDLLEQRIGRLDRIGQQNDINIYPLFFAGTPQEVVFEWYHKGMDAFSYCNPVGDVVFRKTASLLHETMLEYDKPGKIDTLVSDTSEIAGRYRSQLEDGRDRLVAINSFNRDMAEDRIRKIRQLDHASLQQFMESIFDQYGVESEEQSDGTLVIRPGDEMAITSFPGVPEDGLTATYSRELALARDDIQFLTWEHPMVRGSIDLVLQQDTGSSVVSVLKSKNIPEGSVLLEMIFTIICSAPASLMADRYLPDTCFRLLIDKNGKNLSETIKYESLRKLCHPIDRPRAGQIAKMLKDDIEPMTENAMDIADTILDNNRYEAIEACNKEYSREISRLESLSAINPGIRPAEISSLQQRRDQLIDCLQESEAQLEAINLIVTTNE